MKTWTFCLLLLGLASCSISKVQSEATPITHEDFTNLLKKHVDLDGMVDYKGLITDSLKLNAYLTKLAAGHPNDKNWSRNEQIAYWINAYNAYTLQIVMRNYPVESIKDIGGSIPFTNTVWDQKFINIEGQVYDLNNIEHGILRKQFVEPRIHFALVCASYSCPPLRNEAFEASSLDSQLVDQAKLFINDGDRNRITTDSANVSKIFSWFSGDFKKTSTSVKDFINEYSEIEISEEVDLKYNDYYWNLNEQQ